MTKRPTGDYLLLLDASAYIHRAFHALPRLTRQSDGLQTGALYGFCNTMLKVFRLNWTAIGSLPRYGAVIMDVRGKNWRHEIYPDYKAQRKPYDVDLVAQLSWIPTIAEAFNVPAIGLAGWEADDIIATYAEIGRSEGIDVVIASSDKDLYSLVDEENGSRVLLYDAMKDKLEDSSGAIIGEDLVHKKFGVWPYQISDLLAITGDIADNVPGIEKFGPVTAARLLNQFKTLDAIIEAAEWEPEKFQKPKEAAKIAENTRLLRLSRSLVELRADVPVELGLDDLYIKPASSQTLRGLLMDLDLFSLLPKVDRPTKI